MSDSYSGGNYSGIVNISLADDSGSSKALDRATKLLAGIPGGIEKAASSSLTRAATSGTAAVAREVNKDYSLNTSDFKKYTKSSQHIQKSGDEISVGLSFADFMFRLSGSTQKSPVPGCTECRSSGTPPAKR